MRARKVVGRKVVGIIVAVLGAVASVLGVIGFFASDYPNLIFAKPLAEPILRKDDQSISWDLLDNAGGYELEIVQGEYKKTITLSGSESSYQPTELTSGALTATLKAISNSKKFKNSISDEYIFYQLPAPSNIVFSPNDSSLAWNEITQSGSDISYQVFIRDPQDTLIETLDTNRTVLSTYPEGIIHLSLRSLSTNISDDVLTSKSSELRIANRFRASFSNNVLSWNSLKGATGYQVWAGANYSDNLASTVTSYNLNNLLGFEDQTATITVKALMGETAITYPYSNGLTVGHPGLITEAAYDSKSQILDWTATSNAELYDVYLNNSFKATTKASNLFIDNEPGYYEARITPRITSIDALSGIAKTFRFVHNLTPILNGTILSWPSVANGSYRLNIEGQVDPINVGTATSYNLLNANLPIGHSKVIVELLLNDKIIDMPFYSEITISKAAPVENISYDGTSLNWAASANAVSYVLEINEQVLLMPSTTRTYNLSGYAAGIYKISVRPIINLEEYFQEKHEITIAHKFQLSYSDNMLSWNSFEGAKYRLLINDDVVNAINVNQSTNYDANLLPLNTGVNTIKVIVLIDDREVEFGQSNDISVTKLGSINNLSYQNKTVSWDNIPNATGYRVAINDVDIGIQPGPSFDFTNYSSAIYEVKVTPVGDSSSLTALPSTITFVHNLTLQYNDNILSWGEISGATYSLIYGSANEEVLLDSNLSVDLRTLSGVIPGLNNFAVKVSIAGKILNFPLSETKQLTKLTPVTNITYVGGEFHWQSINSGVTYGVNLNDNVTNVSETKLSHSLVLGLNAVSITAKKEGPYIDSDPTSQEFTTTQLANPNVTVTRHTTFTNMWNIAVGPVEGANNYLVRVDKYSDETNFTTVNVTFSQAIKMSQLFDFAGLTKVIITVIAKGDGTDVLILDSSPVIITKVL